MRAARLAVSLIASIENACNAVYVKPGQTKTGLADKLRSLKIRETLTLAQGAPITGFYQQARRLHIRVVGNRQKDGSMLVRRVA